MNTALNSSAACEPSMWLENLVDGLAGTTIKAKHSVYCEASPFQKIEVFDTYAFGRVLLLGGSIMYTESDGHVYNEMITHPAMLCHPAPRNICVIGGGDGGSLQEVLKHQSVEHVAVVEIDRQVTECVKEFFPHLAAGFTDKRVSLSFDDGYAWISRNTGLFDVIIVDSYDPGGPVQSLETGNFFELVRKFLAPGGQAVIQTDAPQLNREKINRTMRELSTHFVSLRPFFAAIPSFPLGMCSFVLCDPDSGETRSPDIARIEPVARQCSYYNTEIQTGAFCLPGAVRETFSV